MARPIYRYQPINLFPDRTIGIKLPFNRNVPGNNSRSGNDSYSGNINGSGLFSLSRTTEEQSTSNLINLMLTETGERIMQPKFGTNLRRVLFNQNTQNLQSAVDTVIRDAVSYWLPYIEIVDLLISRDVDRYIFSVKIVYRVTNFPAEQVINVLLSENTIQVIPVPVTTTNTAPTLVQVNEFGGFY
jgi:phage baseplate assembly protein W